MQTRKYPRTLEQAFGPYARGPVYEQHQTNMHTADKIVLWSCGIAVVCFVVIFSIWG